MSWVCVVFLGGSIVFGPTQHSDEVSCLEACELAAKARGPKAVPLCRPNRTYRPQQQQQRNRWW